MTSWRRAVLSFSALPEVGMLLLDPKPSWIWSRDGTRILWANPAGGARLGAECLAEIVERRWPRDHPLRREVESLFGAMPDAGSMARLRIVDDSRAVPIAARAKRVRAGEERGVLVVAAADAAGGRTPLARLVEFLAAVDTGAVLLGESGELLAQSAAGLAVSPGDAFAEFADDGRKLRLFLPARTAGAAGNVGTAVREVEEASAPAADLDGAVDAADPAARTGQAVDAAEAGPPFAAERARLHSETESRAAELAWISPMSTAAGDSARAQALGAKPVPRVARPETRIGAAAASGASSDFAARPVSVGRVARELSRKPVRFLWQTDAADRVLFVSPGLGQVVGRNAEIVGERWQDAAARLRLDPSLRILRALAQHDTWSGLTAWWPIEGSMVRVPTELTALPVFGGDQSFQGYRGFGVLRPAEALMPAAFEARFGTAEQPVPKPATQLPPYEEAITTVPANVVPIRATLERLVDQTRLTPQERNAFEEIAAALSQRVIEPPVSEELEAEPAQEATGEEHPSAGIDRTRDFEPESETEVSTSELHPAVMEEIRPADEAHSPGLSAAASPPDEGLSTRAAEATSPPPAEEDSGVLVDPLPTAHVEAPESAAPAAVEEQPAQPPSEAARRARAHRRLRDGEAERRLREMNAVLDTATDGVLILDSDGNIESANASAEALFGLNWHELQNMDIGELLTPETRQMAIDYLDGLKENGVASMLNEGREVDGRAGASSIPLFITMGRISDEDGGRFCAVLRDITHWKRTEAELIAARRAAEAASHQKSEFLARVSHEIRTPLNAIVGFAEVMIEERFGPVENERYREYLRDIRTSGEHVVSLINDLLDISKIEAGKLDLSFVAVPLNDLVRECIALMQPEANRAHVVLRSSLSRQVPAIVADQRTMRQIVLNLLSNSVKFTGPGGQVIASTTLAESGEATLRIRDTGEGMSEDELARALEPFRQIATTTLADRSGTGLGLPLTKALVEANRASLSIRSARGEGTVVTVTFPPTRVLSE